ncbi:MAG: hypothetical protein ACR2OG_13550 [Gemmatimonadaceae bacterium]
MTTPVTVFVNSQRLQVSPDATVLDAVRAWSSEAAGQLEDGHGSVTDSRGLPIPLAAAVYGGAIFRLVTSRDRGADGAGSRPR